ncbi:MAG: protein-L-isoaspartate(D-aspartate) O-methyltransferase [Spirochaetia bacterium]
MNRKAVLLGLTLFLVAALVGASDTEDGPTPDPQGKSPPRDLYDIAREALVARYITGAGIRDAAVIDAMLAVPRHEFVLPEYRGAAYEDRPLPITAGQTISQPYVVAFMTEVLQLGPEDTVLEVGTGSGYQAAVLAEIVAEVYTVEIIDTLAGSAAARLSRLGYDNVTVVADDGYYGLTEEAPFDAVIVTAAAGHVPAPLVEQLKPGGRMIIPVGPVYSVQVLILLEKAADGSISTQQLLPVRFVPMTGRVQE